MEVLLNLSFNTNLTVTIVNIVIIAFIVLSIISGFKEGFFEAGIKFIGTVIAFILSYLLKNPVSVFMYNRLPFFKLSGVFEGVTVINILIYEFVSFILVFLVMMLILKLICEITEIVDKLISWIVFIGIPNKILGAVVGFLEGIVTLYFAVVILNVGSNIFGYYLEPSLADDILEVPILKETFGSSFTALDEIVEISKDYKDTHNKGEFNYKALDILLKYEVITKNNVIYLVNNGKLNIENIEVLLEKY